MNSKSKENRSHNRRNRNRNRSRSQRTARFKDLKVSMSPADIERYNTWHELDPSIPDLSCVLNPDSRLVEILVDNKMVVTPIVFEGGNGRYACLTMFAMASGVPTLICTTNEGTQLEAERNHAKEVARNFFLLAENKKLRLTIG